MKSGTNNFIRIGSGTKKIARSMSSAIIGPLHGHPAPIRKGRPSSPNVRMRYLGSKASVAPDILQVVQQHRSGGKFCDPFGGLGTVGAHFKARGYEVCTGDHLDFAYYFQIARIELNSIPPFTGVKALLGLDHADDISSFLNSLEPMHGWLTENYATDRRFFTVPNAMRIDAIWSLIREWRNGGLVTRTEFALLVASLIDSMDRIANTAGTYYAYLKHWYRKALRPFKFVWVAPTAGKSRCHAHFDDAAVVASAHSTDVLYLDPPYNTRKYGDYYHLPQSIALGYTGPVRGMAGVPTRDRSASRFSVRSTAREALVSLIDQCRWHLLVIHYSDAGLVTPAQLRSILPSYGRLSEYSVQAKGYSTTGLRSTPHRIYVVERA